MHFSFQVSNILFFILPPLLIRLHCSYAAHCGKGETQKKRSQIIQLNTVRYSLDPEVLAESTQTLKGTAYLPRTNFCQNLPQQNLPRICT